MSGQNCKWCDGFFRPKHMNVKYCSESCRTGRADTLTAIDSELRKLSNDQIKAIFAELKGN